MWQVRARWGQDGDKLRQASSKMKARWDKMGANWGKMEASWDKVGSELGQDMDKSRQVEARRNKVGGKMVQTEIR